MGGGVDGLFDVLGFPFGFSSSSVGGRSGNLGVFRMSADMSATARVTALSELSGILSADS